jgi:hypothetical protein
MTPMPFGAQHGLHISNYSPWSQRQGHAPTTTRPPTPPQARPCRVVYRVDASRRMSAPRASDAPQQRQ